MLVITRYISIAAVLLSFILGYLLAYRRQERHIEKINKSHIESITLMKSKYESEMKAMESKLETAQLNDIVSTVINFKPNGEKSFTQIVDKSRTHKKIESTTTELEIKEDITDKTFLAGDNVEGVKDSSSNSSKQYMVGLTGLQVYPINKLTDNLSIMGGARLGSLPLYITSSIQLHKDFYNNISVGLLLEF